MSHPHSIQAHFSVLPDPRIDRDTFGRVFSRLDPKAFETCFQSWRALMLGDSETLLA